MSLPKNLENFSYKNINENIIHIELSRPEKLNTMTPKFFEELSLLFSSLENLPDLRVVILTAQGKHFSAGLDLNVAPSLIEKDQDDDQARSSIKIIKKLKIWQEAFTLIENLRVPVLMGINYFFFNFIYKF